MSTQAIGAAAAGTAILGGGGATIAYAAGAFDPTTYFYKANEDSEFKNTKEYIGDKPDQVKAWLIDNTKEKTYKGNLKTKLESGMDLRGIRDKPSTERINKLSTPNTLAQEEAKDIYDYTKEWCEFKKGLAYDKEKNNDDFENFKTVCFVNKIPKATQ
ncbi:hypothetical protein [Candidatus Mycoplasma haematohominis]|uniref:Uncharacterized protein n=1 Tax=Candidatus Mycoplasma haematohominis TaxID=1494318 RepID=A0A478FQR9_9MOLU|nr:hypothetical protein [Candidatus Mycoplasma haemohominis]GCE63712.1 hypothetical protein MHSWG343_07120 [Candidatus Mycoplasma haemohominis]